MFSSLQGLDISNQRAYLEITDSDLDLLLGGSSSAKTSLQDKESVMRAIAEVRGNVAARD